MSRVIKQLSTISATALLLTYIVIVVVVAGRFASAQTPSVNHPPLPNPKTVTTNENTPIDITLTGTDIDPGDTITFTILDRPFHGTISVGSTPNSVKYTPMTGYVGPDVFTYTATDNHGFSRTKALVSITVSGSTTNPPPTAVVGPDQTVNEGSPVTLDGHASTDPRGGTLTYQWTQTAGPSVTLSNPISAIATFTAPSVSTNNTLMSFRLTVTNRLGLSGSATERVTVTTRFPSPGSPGVDRFGISEIYPTKPGGEEWYFNTNDPNNDPRTGTDTTFVQRNSDGSWKVKSSQVRYDALTSSGWHPELITTLNQQELAAKGYLQSPNDWKNVEMTGFLKVNSAGSSTQNGAAHIEFLARGGRNSNEQTKVGGLSLQCEATTYHSNTYNTGRAKFEKDLMHTAGYTANSQDPQVQHATSTLQGRWIGVKAVFYNLPNGSVKLEQWLDDSTNNINAPRNQWHKVLEFIDGGHWGGGHPKCGGTDHTIITWGGPRAIFRWDNVIDMDVTDFSVREIKPL